MGYSVTKVVIGNSSFGEIPSYAEDIPIEIVDKMLMAEADAVEPTMERNAQTVLKGEYWTGQTARALTRKPPHIWRGKRGNGQRQVTLTFKGVRHDKYHKKGERNATIAFVNEYGARSIPARPFIQMAIDATETMAFDSAEKIFDEWLKKEKM